MIYTDGHSIISDSGVQGLHWFAERLGLSRYLFESPNVGGHPHYKRPKDLPTYKLLESGAKFVTTRHLIEIARNSK